MSKFDRLSHHRKKKVSATAQWLARNIRVVLVVTILLIVGLATAIVLYWSTIVAYINIMKLDSVHERNRAEAFEALIEMEEAALPALLFSARNEDDYELFRQKMMLIDALEGLDKTPLDDRIRYYYLMIDKRDWPTSVKAMKKLVELGDEAAPYIAKILESAYPVYQYVSLCVLAEIGSPSVSDSILPFIYEEELSLKKKAFYALVSTDSLDVHREEILEYIVSENFRTFDEEMKEFAIQVIGKMQTQQLDERMKELLEKGRPFETRLAAGYFALSKNMDNVRMVMDIIVQPYESPQVRNQVLNSLKTRLDDKELHKVMLEYLIAYDTLQEEKKILTAGLERYIANQYFAVAKLTKEELTQMESLLDSDLPESVKWDIAIALAYHGVEKSFPYLEQALVSGSDSSELERSARLAAIALGESLSPSALNVLVRHARAGDQTKRSIAIYWGLRVFGMNEGSWKLPETAKTVYPILKNIAEDISEPILVRGYAKKAIEEIKTRPGQRTGPTVPELTVMSWNRPLFTGKGRNINELIAENLNYYEFPEYDKVASTD
ncbi:MAG: HEAT repeat domain-containing protein [Planctomycetota bacterium]|nr:HEAT repeat domain-containing protein [Planctomycetota bacterium]